MSVTPEPQAEGNTILIVDDTPANLGVIVESFEDDGFRVVIAQDGEEGLERAVFVQPQLILLDVLLPGMSGFEVCRHLKATAGTRNIPVIFMTALTDTEHKVAGFAAGGVDYVTKPLQIEEVVARVYTHLHLRMLQKQLEVKNAQLHQYQEGLEQLVAERTAALRNSNRQLREEIDERKRAERSLALMNFALDHVREAAYLIGEHGQLLYVNDECCRVSGYSRRELLAMRMFDLDPTWPEEEWLPCWRRLRKQGVLIVESHHRAKDGRTFPVEVTANYFEYSGHAYALALTRDITERKEADRRLEESRMQLRALAANRDDAREEERKHIARELHDELGQFLTALRMNVSLLRVRFGESNPALLEHVKNMTELVDRTIQVVRNVAASLRPAALDMGVQAALEWLVEEFVTHTGIPCELQVTEARIDLDDHRATAVFRVLQESLTNVARHADASQVKIVLQCNGQQYQIDVCDNGKGFDPDHTRKKSLGLVGMRERVLILGGEFSIASKPGQGTTLEVRIPVHDRLQGQDGR